ncbi:MAG TPA: MBOAT family O-acyltransferase [Phnomibacter sp.]|nr:MBOAT family O-acyltransferase [Phnomibacter sp.]
MIDYFVGLGLEKIAANNKKTLLTLSIIANVGVLAVFKYYNFFTENLNYLTGASLPFLKILLPVGLSFHTFQAMSYTIEIYRGKQKAERHFGIYALYVMFYPQLVAGPIERPQNILHQFHERKPFIPSQVADGLCSMLWGAFKKIVVADRLAIYVDAVFDNYENQTGSSLLLASLFFSIQIYCDFSGYSDIAQGCAKSMGYDLMTNFKRPYFAASISQFWRRWHISLSTWFRDYLYIPLGGNRVSASRWYFNIMIVFLVSGLWHGPSWTFVAWGGIHGVLTILSLLFAKIIIVERTKNLLRSKSVSIAYNLGSVFVVFLLVTLAWIFFRSHSFSQASTILLKIVTDANSPIFLKTGQFMAYSFLGIAILALKELKDELQLPIHCLSNSNLAIRTTSAFFLIVLIVLTGVLDSSQFIYFQF